MKLRAWCLPVAILVVACGSRTGLEGPPGVTFASCSEPPWLLFDVHGGPAWSMYAMRADGSQGRPVTLPNGPAAYPSVSPDGSQLFYAVYLPGGSLNESALYDYDLARRTSRLVLTTTDLTYSALSPDGMSIAYVSHFSVRIASPDGTHDRTLVAGSDADGTAYGHPTFAGDPNRVIYVGSGTIGEIGVDGSANETLFSSQPGQFPNPAFSPDDTRLVLGAYCSQTSTYALRLYTYSSFPGATCESGQVLAEVTYGSSQNSANDPSWGPNDEIAYASGKDVFVLDMSAGAPGVPVNVTAGMTGDAGTVTASDPVWVPGCAALP